MHDRRQKFKTDNYDSIQSMNAFPGTSRLLEAAIVEIDPFDSLASVIVFSRYDLETPRAQAMYGGQDR